MSLLTIEGDTQFKSGSTSFSSGSLLIETPTAFHNNSVFIGDSTNMFHDAQLPTQGNVLCSHDSASVGFTVNRNYDFQHASFALTNNGDSSTGWKMQMRSGDSHFYIFDQVYAKTAFSIREGGELRIQKGSGAGFLEGDSNAVAQYTSDGNASNIWFNVKDVGNGGTDANMGFVVTGSVIGQGLTYNVAENFVALGPDCGAGGGVVNRGLKVKSNGDVQILNALLATSSYATSAVTAATASYAASAIIAAIASTAITASYATLAVTALTASTAAAASTSITAVTSSYATSALTASYVTSAVTASQGLKSWTSLKLNNTGSLVQTSYGCNVTRNSIGDYKVAFNSTASLQYSVVANAISGTTDTPTSSFLMPFIYDEQTLYFKIKFKDTGNVLRDFSTASIHVAGY